MKNRGGSSKLIDKKPLKLSTIIEEENQKAHTSSPKRFAMNENWWIGINLLAWLKASERNVERWKY